MPSRQSSADRRYVAGGPTALRVPFGVDALLATSVAAQDSVGSAVGGESQRTVPAIDSKQKNEIQTLSGERLFRSGGKFRKGPLNGSALKSDRAMRLTGCITGTLSLHLLVGYAVLSQNPRAEQVVAQQVIWVRTARSSDAPRMQMVSLLPDSPRPMGAIGSPPGDSVALQPSSREEPQATESSASSVTHTAHALLAIIPAPDAPPIAFVPAPSADAAIAANSLDCRAFRGLPDEPAVESVDKCSTFTEPNQPQGWNK